MTASRPEVLDGRHAADLQRAGRALLKEPLLLAHGPYADEFRLVRRLADELRDWFDRDTGWPLQVDAESARLRRTPGSPADPTHPAREVSRSAVPFTGTPAQSPWDPALTPALAELGVRVEEEAVLGDLLSDLAG
jgi:uncharacterized protein (TIGR02678 family)